MMSKTRNSQLQLKEGITLWFKNRVFMATEDSILRKCLIFLSCLPLSFAFQAFSCCWISWAVLSIAVVDFAAASSGTWPEKPQRQQFHPEPLGWFHTCHCHNSSWSIRSSFGSCWSWCWNSSWSSWWSWLQTPDPQAWFWLAWEESWSCPHSWESLEHHWCWRCDSASHWQSWTRLRSCSWSWLLIGSALTIFAACWG